MSLIPGTLVLVNGMGILLRGPAGSGKSDTALALIHAGHRLVADDAVDIQRLDDTLVGSAPAAGAGLLCLRGPGLIDVAACFGDGALARSATVDRVVDLVDEPLPASTEADWRSIRIHGVPCPRMAVVPERPLSALLEVIATGGRTTQPRPEAPACG
ncbi:HPr kinase/phosphatase C-terminal domain-containing protein [Spiribacter sp. 221]|uniref:HPr kinase/phosphorylase n=1 Tax=Spiribacter onubensis TaxID=3122420 RepID=UPI00349F9613